MRANNYTGLHCSRFRFPFGCLAIGRVEPGFAVGDIISDERDRMTMRFVMDTFISNRLNHTEIVIFKK